MLKGLKLQSTHTQKFLHMAWIQRILEEKYENLDLNLTSSLGKTKDEPILMLIFARTFEDTRI